MNSFRFAYPWLLTAIPVLLLVAWWWSRRGGHVASLLFPSLEPFDGAPVSLRAMLATWLPPLFRWLALICGIVALARPQTVQRKQWFESTGVEIVLSLDTSGSMRTLDMDPKYQSQVNNVFGGYMTMPSGNSMTRLDVVKGVVQKFVRKRKGDRVSLIVFGTKARPLCPLTHDLSAVSELVKSLDVDMVGPMTDLRKGIEYGLKRMIGLTVEDVIEMARSRSEEYVLEQIRTRKASFVFEKDTLKRITTAKLSKKVILAMRRKKRRSQILILLTDGKHTATPGQEGRDEVLKAAKAAALYNIKIYTIGVGTREGRSFVKLPARNGQPARVVPVRGDSYDEDLLRNIARVTGGRFFSAQSRAGLKQVYKDINTLEPNRYKVHNWDDVRELYLFLLLPMLLLLGLELLLKETVLGGAL